MNDQQSKALQLRRLRTRLEKYVSHFHTLINLQSQAHVAEVIAELLQEIDTLKMGQKQRNYVM